MDLSPAHHRAATVAAQSLGREFATLEPQRTWGPTVVVKVISRDGLTAFIKAGANQNVHTEAAVIDRAQTAGVRAVDVLATGTDEQLPGGRWMITRAAEGQALEDAGLTAPTITRTLADLAEQYAQLHQTSLPGRGPIAPDGSRATLDTWSQWQQQVLEEALTKLTHRNDVTATFADRARLLAHQFAATLDQTPAALLHADLGDRELYVDPSNGHVTAIVDWGSALVGDPLYDVARFVAGGPANDPRPGQLSPLLQHHYFARAPHDPDHANRLLLFYRFHICLVEAAWEPSWAPAHTTWADNLITELS
ncbi:phosphotransferase family protein [Kribbella sp. NPDC056345]|uniref:phosphotransferase family protein n=1 Tax=Kribbella sp. NPDC056345 TaxID=3345789 RepID=UPI0035DE15A8